MIVRPAKRIRGEIRLPGDKSISHRAALIAAMADGESRLDNFATSADCASTLNCLRQLGVPIRQEGTTVWVNGMGRSGFQKPDESLDCGNSGTTMRLLAGVLAGQEFESVLIGDDSLMKRPMKRIAEPLSAMGATVETVDGHAPVRISGSYPLTSIEYELPVASAQIKSCVLLAGMYASGETSVIEPSPTRDHTERMLRKFGVPVTSEHIDGSRFRHRIMGGGILEASDVTVPGDISAAAFFMVGAACLEGSDVSMPGVGMGAGRTGIIGVLRSLGARLEVNYLRETIRSETREESETVGNIRVLGGFGASRHDHSIPIGGLLIPNLIDEIPILAILGTQHEKGIEIRDASELRVKETDRIAAIVENLRRMGAEVEEFEDGLKVKRSRLRAAQVDSFGDHRIAMAFAIAGLLADEGETEIVGAECAAVSFPGFFEVLESVVDH